MDTTKIPGGKELIDSKTLLEKIGIAEKMAVADLGCGRRGYFSLQAAKLVGPQGTVYAVDIIQTALQNVESMAKLFGISNLKTIWANLEIPSATKIPNEIIDLVMINNVLFQTKKGDSILKEAARILKKGGKLEVTDWKKIAVPFGPVAEERISQEEVKKYAQSAGLKFEQEFDAGPYHYTLVFVK
ncbi:MAG: methyltransferase domain-containing protein [Patescibacteria group bacterium]|nr:methyltransferase domain-containing protein [Patescibacteria group bacterium]MDD5164905.1 methyltransferase domain-containing protein [Patescibacteria group bacterium]MDD5534710.1 methyltransferase domain-containing protein [Patescibacteria group bacterium]